MTNLIKVALLASAMVSIPVISSATTLAGGYPVDTSNLMCQSAQADCYVNVTLHPSREEAVRKQASTLGVRIQHITHDSSRSRQMINVTGPGGFGEYMLSDGCVSKIESGIPCESGEPAGSGCTVQNNELVTAAYQLRRTTVVAPTHTAPVSRPVQPVQTSTYTVPTQVAASFDSNYQRGPGMHWRTPGLDTKNKVITDLVPDTRISLGIQYQINPDSVNVNQQQFLQPGAPYVPPVDPTPPPSTFPESPPTPTPTTPVIEPVTEPPSTFPRTPYNPPADAPVTPVPHVPATTPPPGRFPRTPINS